MESNLKSKKSCTLGYLASCYGRSRKSFKQILLPLIETKLCYLSSGQIRKIPPRDIKLIAEYLGDVKYRINFPKLTLTMIANSYGWSLRKLHRNINPIRSLLDAHGLKPKKALTPSHAQMIYSHLGIPEKDTEIAEYFNF